VFGAQGSHHAPLRCCVPWHYTCRDGPGTKRTFKEKLQAAIYEAEVAQAAAAAAAALQDRKSLSIALLVEGRPQAFVDFFRLMHLPPARLPGGGGRVGAAPQQTTPSATSLLDAEPNAMADLPQVSMSTSAVCLVAIAWHRLSTHLDL
jgi:hypothetical protein